MCRVFFPIDIEKSPNTPPIPVSRSLEAVSTRTALFDKPQIEKTVPQFLTTNEFKLLIRLFSDQADSPLGLRNLVIIMLSGAVGLRTRTPISLNIEDIDIRYGLVRIRGKDNRQRHMVLPHCHSILFAIAGTKKRLLLLSKLVFEKK